MDGLFIYFLSNIINSIYLMILIFHLFSLFLSQLLLNTYRLYTVCTNFELSALFINTFPINVVITLIADFAIFSDRFLKIDHVMTLITSNHLEIWNP